MTDLATVAKDAVAIPGVASAAIFVTRPPEPGLALVAAAGIDGPPLDALVAAVQDPMHPVARSLHDTDATFDVRPMNPGGPALRSHLPLGGRGVLALAHEPPLDADARTKAERLAAIATNLLGD